MLRKVGTVYHSDCMLLTSLGDYAWLRLFFFCRFRMELHRVFMKFWAHFMNTCCSPNTFHNHGSRFACLVLQRFFFFLTFKDTFEWLVWTFLLLIGWFATVTSHPGTRLNWPLSGHTVQSHSNELSISSKNVKYIYIISICMWTVHKLL